MKIREFGSVLRRRDAGGRPRARWCVRYTDAQGRRHLRTAGTTRASAEALLARLEGEVRLARRSRARDGAELERDAERPFGFHVPAILRAWESVLAEGTMRGRTGSLRRWAERLGRTPVSELRQADVQERVRRMRAEKLAASTVRTEVRILSAAFTTMRAALEVPLPRNPCSGVVLPPVHVNPRPHLAAAEVRRLLEACPEDQADPGGDVRGAVTLLADAGLRPAELLRLTWGEVALELGSLRLARTKTYLTRTIPLTARAREVLRRWREFHGGEPASDPVLQLSERRLREGFRAAARAAGLPKLVPYTLRHAYACSLLVEHAPPSVVRDLLGHSNIRTTDVYLRSLPGDAARAAVDALERARA